MFRWILTALFLFLTVEVHAANHYIRAAASGTADGSDWTNACTDFAGSCAVASLVRGDTYYVATGTYAALQLNTADSGTSVITISGATVAAHGTSTGWANSYSVSSADGGAQAQFTFSVANAGSAVQINTDHWVFDGTVGSGGTSSTYGFLMLKASPCSTDPQQLINIGNSGSTQTDLTLKHIAFVGCGAAFDVKQMGLFIGCGNCYTTSSTFSYSFFDGFQGSWSLTNLANSTIEQNWSQNQWSSGTNHGETVGIGNCHNSDSAGCSTACTQGQCGYNVTFRYNIIKNCRGTACLAGLGPGNIAAINAWKIYGNVFVDSQAGNGVIATGGGNFVIKDTLIYNNDFISNGSSNIFWQCEGDPQCASASGNVIENNLHYNSTTSYNAQSGGAITHDYNTFLSSTDTPPTETHGQVDTFNPLVNSAIGASGDYHLTAAGAGLVNVGLVLSSPYNADRDVVTRGGDNKWDRGAYEYNTGGSKGCIKAPTNLKLTSGLQFDLSAC